MEKESQREKAYFYKERKKNAKTMYRSKEHSRYSYQTAL